MKKVYFLIILTLASLINLRAQELRAFLLHAPEIQMQNVSKIAILDFSVTTTDYYNDYKVASSKLTDYMTEILLNEKRGIYNITDGFFSSTIEGKTYQKPSSINIFKLIERNQLNQVLTEQNMMTDGLISDDKAAQVGKLLGIDVIIVGSINIVPKTSTTKKTYTNGTYEYCKENQVTTSATIKIISVSTGEILGTATFTKSLSDSQCGKYIDNVKTYGQLADACLQPIAFSMVYFFAPHYMQYKFDFEKIKVKEFKDKAKDIDTYLENGDFNKVFSIYKAIYDADNYNGAAAFNLALLYEMIGDMENCLYYFQIANDIDDQKYGKFLQYANQYNEQYQKLIKMGITFEKMEFQINDKVLANKVMTKGRDSDRLEVYAETNSSSSIVTKVPGGKEFVLIEQKGEWYYIELLGGKKGYIHQNFIKQ